MRRILLFTLALVVVGLTLTPAGAVAQQNATDAPQLEVDTGATTNATEYSEEIDSNLRLMEWNYDDDRDGFVLVFEADRSKRITITEAVQFEEGSGSGSIYAKRLPAGVTRVFVPVQRRGGEAAVTMTTSESISENRFSYVSTGQHIDRPPIAYEHVRLLVGGTAVGAGALTLRTVRKKRDDETKEVERLL